MHLGAIPIASLIGAIPITSLMGAIPTASLRVLGTSPLSFFYFVVQNTGWTSATNRPKVWTVPYMAEKLALLLVLHKQMDS